MWTGFYLSSSEDRLQMKPSVSIIVQAFYVCLPDLDIQEYHRPPNWTRCLGILHRRNLYNNLLVPLPHFAQDSCQWMTMLFGNKSQPWPHVFRSEYRNHRPHYREIGSSVRLAGKPACQEDPRKISATPCSRYSIA